MNDKKVKTYGIVLGVLLFLLLAVGITYAVLAWKSSNISILGNAECLDINYVKGNNISDEILLFDESQIINNNKITIKNGMGLTNVTAGIKSNCTIDGYITINLNVSSLNNTFTSSGTSYGALKYVLASYDPSTYTTVNTTTLNNISFNILEKGSITQTGTIKIYEDQLSNTKTNGYLLILYIDGDLVTNYTGDNITASLEAVVTQGKTAAVYIKRLFTPNTTVTNNGIAYNYDTTHNLMQDIGGNIRYYGANPNNYIDIGDIYESNVTKGKWEELGAPFTTEDECKAYFNCSTNYSMFGFSSEDECNSQLPTQVQQRFGMTIEEFNNTYCVIETIVTKGTPILYRIIGVFGDKIKLIRNEVIGAYAWDNKNTSTGAETDYGKNDWTDARLMKLLNPGYESETTGGSLYYNSGSGSCYSGQNNATTTCDFTSTGIKNDTTRNLISDTLYYLGGWNTSEIYSDQIYGYERGTTVYSGRPTTWTGKIALPYPSDYGYAADLGSCTQSLLFYDNSTCTSANWMKPILGTSSWGWLLTPDSAYSHYAWNVYSSGNVGYSDNTFNAYGVAPVLYLGSEQVIESGTGTNSDPYRLSVS